MFTGGYGVLAHGPFFQEKAAKHASTMSQQHGTTKQRLQNRAKANARLARRKLSASSGPANVSSCESRASNLKYKGVTGFHPQKLQIARVH